MNNLNIMDFRFKNPVILNKSFILSNITEEQIMSFYLKIPIDKKKLFCSPLRNDKFATCSIFRSNTGTLLFKDFATGEALNCFEIVKRLFHCDYFKALRIIANDFGIIPDTTLQKNPGKINENPIKIQDKEISKIQVEIQDFTDLELKWWEKYGITPEILDHFNIFSCKHVFLNGQLFAKSQQHCPIFGYYGGKIQKNKEKIELWKCYFPKRKNYRWISNYSKDKIQGFDKLPKNGNLLVITKSMKDVACLYSCGINACAPNSENLFISDAVLEELKSRFDNIVVLYDNDRPGLYNMAKIRRNHPELVFTYIPKKYGSKDISDFYKEHKRKETLNLIKEFILWLKEHRRNLTHP